MPHGQMKSCIDACYACATECDHCAAACLRENDVKMLARCIQLDIDCAEICRLAAGYMGRGSELTADICEACADVCDMCAEECEKHDKMEHCRACARACRQCAQECRRMASAHPRPGRPERAGAQASAH